MDPLGLDWIDDFLYGGTNFFNGFTNKIGFGWITHPVQDWLGVSGEIDHCSSAYNAGQIGGTVYNVVNTAVNAYSFAKSIPAIVEAAQNLPELLSNAKAALCFTAGTQVVMADGTTKPIEQIQAGDLVLTRDQHDDANGKVVAKKVLKTSVRQAPATLEVTLSTGEKIECTPEHPFYVAGKGFVEAKDLGIGTSIVTRAGPAVQVANIKRHDAPSTVYNFVVEDTHTYFVGTGSGGVEVHNGPCTGTFPKTVEEMDEAMGFDGVRSENASGKVTWDAGKVRIRAEEHPLEPGETFSPRHHGLHYHVEVRPDTSIGWNNAAVTKMIPPGYTPGSGTGFLPGESFPDW